MQRHRGILLGIGMNYAWSRQSLKIYFSLSANYIVCRHNRGVRVPL